MTAALRRVFLIGLLSHVLAFSTMFTILSGLTPHGTDYIWCYFVTNTLLGGVIYWMTQTQQEGARRVLLIVCALVVLAGVGWLFLLRPQNTGLDFLLEAFFAILSAIVLRRMVLMVADMKYIRQLLLEQYRNDLIMIVLFVLIDVLFIGSDPAWQSKMLPFFVGFLLTRMIALSLASQLTHQQNMRKSMIEKFQRSAPVLLTVGGLLLLWMLSVSGGPIWRFIVRSLTPLFSGLYYGLTQLATASSVPGWLRAFFALVSRWLNEFLCWIAGGLCDGPGSTIGVPQSQRKLELTSDHTVSWLWLEILIGAAIVGGIVFYFYRILKRLSMARTQEGAVEIREFIQRAPQKAKAHRHLTIGVLTPMRKTYRKFLLAMQKAGFVRRDGETASELVGKVAVAFPHLQQELKELTDYYQQERYGNQSVEAQLQRAEELSRELSKRPEKE